ncbi:uncharacterized protein LOC130719928 [Lotus japonicus]|uniref:uncharacterized protein LOC130719928 n=1 Tax=Lotus japonicus TaxID=34305 RepID=UPI002590EB5C|nr:uncharacterized protein LOC130719928 [Lotus japonicus]
MAPSSTIGGEYRQPPSDEEEQTDRTKKKVRTTSDEDSEKFQDTMMQADDEGNPNLGEIQEPKKLSYKDKVMAGEFASSPFTDQEIVDLVREELMVGGLDFEEAQKERGPFNPNPVVPISLEEYEQWCRPWKFTLVVKLLGKRIGFKWMNQRLHRLWAKEGDVKVIDLADDYFLVRFASENDYKLALFEGPWMVADHYLLVQRWRPMFKAEDDAARKIAVWIRLPKLPVELYNNTFLWRLGSMIALGEEHRLEYEGLHSICFNCGKYGHKSECCPEILINSKVPVGNSPVFSTGPGLDPMQEEQPSRTPLPKPQPEVDKENPKGFGPWMMAKKSQKRKPLRPLNQQNSQQGNGSRFQVLEEELSTKDNSDDLHSKVDQGNLPKNNSKPNHGNQKISQKTNNRHNHPNAIGSGANRKTPPMVEKIHRKETGKAQMTPTAKTPSQQEEKPDHILTQQENDLLETVRKHQLALWEEFKARKANDEEFQGSLHTPSKEELKFVQALLLKKGVGDPNANLQISHNMDMDHEDNGSSGAEIVQEDSPQSF